VYVCVHFVGVTIAGVLTDESGDYMSIDSSCDCEDNDPESLDATTVSLRGISCRACCGHGRSIFFVDVCIDTCIDR